MFRAFAIGCGALMLSAMLSACQHPGESASSGSFPASIRGLGTEPFWSLEIDGTRLAWSSADAPTPQSATIRRHEERDRLIVDGMLDGRSISATVTRSACSDGMSDRTYPFTLQIALASTVFSGCAYPRGMRFPPS